MNQQAIETTGDEGETLIRQARTLMSGQRDRIANSANLSALLFHHFRDVNWAGFYFAQSGQLVVGPFQGKPACVSIPWGKGVCGTAAATREVQRVADVHDFSGHIACDINSRSEIVLPLVLNDELIGVLDLDSPLPDRFTEADEQLLREVVQVYLASID